MTAKSALLTLTPKDMPHTGSNGRSGEALPQRQADVERPVWAGSDDLHKRRIPEVRCDGNVTGQFQREQTFR